MSRREIKTTRFDSLGNPIVEVASIVSTKNNLEKETEPQSYFKRNYFDAIQSILPKFYFSDEEAISGTHISYTDQLINSHIVANNNQATILPVSALIGDRNLSAIDTPQGFSRYFYKQTSPATVSPDDFERDILKPLGKSYKNFTSEEEFNLYISGTFLPSIPGNTLVSTDLATLTASAFSTDSSGTHAYLINTLGWLYFLNRSGPTNGFDPSSGVAKLYSNLWRGKSVVLSDTIKVYQEHLWYNSRFFGLSDDIIPVDYKETPETINGLWTSGIQLLDNLKSLDEIVYSPHFLDSPDKRVQQAFTSFYTTGELISATTGAGPFVRFLRAISYSFADRTTEGNELNTLYDIGKCPDEFIELLGELIGWRFIGVDIDKWRVQLRNAVEIYKMKGTKGSIQLLLDSLFGDDVFNVSSNITELWESYIPDMLYYSLATSSEAFKDFSTYTKELSVHLGIPDYSISSLDTNIRYAVDNIIFSLVKEFPDNFIFSGKPFPLPSFVLKTDDAIVWFGDIHIILVDGKTVYRSGKIESTDSVDLILKTNPEFTFHYRDRDWFVPPYEKRQYYTNVSITNKMVDRIKERLTCYGVDEEFAKSVTSVIKSYTSETLDNAKLNSTMLLMSRSPLLPPNYDVVIREATKESTPDPIMLLSLWNGKSSHFLVEFDSSSFDWASAAIAHNTAYGIGKVLQAVEQVIPAHSIPELLVNLSSVIDSMEAIAEEDCRELRPNFRSYYEGSGQVVTNFTGSSINMGLISTNTIGIAPNRYKRKDVDNTRSPLMSGDGIAYGTDTRNSLRRRNYKNTLPSNRFFTRCGRSNPGSLELSNVFTNTSVGYLPLGYIPSCLGFQPVALVENFVAPFLGNLLGDVSPVWDICQSLTSSSSFFGYNVSDTFASRGKLDITSSDCSPTGRRGQLNEIIYLMNKTHDKEKFLQASSIVSGFINSDGTVNSDWPSVNSDISPSTLSSWHSVFGLNTVRSLANHLIEKESEDSSTNYYENFSFGGPLFRFFREYKTIFESHPISDNFSELSGGPNIFSHTYGPLVYNSKFEVDGSALEASSFLQASSPLEEVDISYFGGKGVLSTSGMNGFGAHDLGTSAASGVSDFYVGKPEFYNKHLVSSIELVDTSSAQISFPHPIFSLLKYSRLVSKDLGLGSYLVDTPIIIYHRPQVDDTFPRLRINIDNSDITRKDRNFLEPDSDYEVKLRVHNLTSLGSNVGGITLGCLIRTQPEDGKVWIFESKGVSVGCGSNIDAWRQVDVSSIQTFGTSKINRFTQTFPMPVKDIDTVSITGPVENFGCFSDFKDTDSIQGTSLRSINKIGEVTLETPVFKFSTKNDKGSIATTSYKENIDPLVHRKNQKYSIEYFLTQGNSTKFIAFEEITLENKTNQEKKAIIPTVYGNIPLTKEDLRTVFLFFSNKGNDINSRDSVLTSSIMEASGGARINYRSDIRMFPHTNSFESQLTEINIDEG